MSKNKTQFKCTNCDYKVFKWQGCCPGCKEWNSFFEETITSSIGPLKSGSLSTRLEVAKLIRLQDVSDELHQRMTCEIYEWDRVLGGGIVPGSFLVLTGDPGIGKSTLLLQVCKNLGKKYKIFYFSSEESLEQVKQRTRRLNFNNNEDIFFSDTSNIESILYTCKEKKPEIVVIDSIQNCYFENSQSIPGSIAQLRESAFNLMRLAKENNIAIILTGHITKEGHIAGPKTLEHMVDGVFYLQGEDRWQTRVLRSVKNRFGAIDELGFFEMDVNGLNEIKNINEQLLKEMTSSPGSALISCIEGSRPILLETQALVVPSKLAMPQRVVTGIDPKRVILIAAILEKYLHIKLSAHDIFFKISGGIKIKESSADLGIALSLLSSYFQKPIPPKSLALGELSLTGQIKSVNQVSLHVNESAKFGIENLYVSANQQINKNSGKVKLFKNVYELLSLFPED